MSEHKRYLERERSLWQASEKSSEAAAFELGLEHGVGMRKWRVKVRLH